MKSKEAKNIKLLMIASGGLSAVILIILIIMSNYYWKLDLIWHLLMCFSVIMIWILINIIGIKIILRKHK